MDGLELCRAIRDGTHYPGYVYIVLCTAHDSEDEILAGLTAGADDYVSKRASGTQLVARLATARRILALEHSLKQAIEERRRMAMTDALTGAYNRRYFMIHLRRELRRARRSGGELVAAGPRHRSLQAHQRSSRPCRGRRRAGRVRAPHAGSLPRDYDWCARLGGEEFAVVLPQTPTSRAAAWSPRRSAARWPRRRCRTTAGTVEVTVSVGVSGLAVFDDRGEATVEQLLRRADDCLYFSKHHGRDRVTLDGEAQR